MLATLLLVTYVGGPIICLDAGHPSEVGIGTQGKTLTEVGVAWNIAGLLRRRLVQDGYTVVMTKESEREKVTNRRRAEIANTSRAALFLRLHCDASHGTGFTLYYPTRSGRSKGVTGPSKAVLTKTAPVAKRFYAGFVGSMGTALKSNGLRSDDKTFIGGKQGALTGSIFAAVPTILVEMVVLTNAKDEAWIGTKAGKGRMVEALAAGVHRAVPIE
jgi:N-acetylmuramoyl-L-alanine amidase